MNASTAVGAIALCCLLSACGKNAADAHIIGIQASNHSMYATVEEISLPDGTKCALATANYQETLAISCGWNR